VLNVRSLKFRAILLIVASLPCGAEAQRPFDASKISGLLSGAKPTLSPPVWGLTFKQQVERCWKMPSNATNEPNIEAEFTIRLKRDGALDGHQF
jgi:hypothetical protein